VLGNGEEIKFESASGAGAEFLRAIEHLDAEMARSCLTQFLVLGQGGNSSVWNLSRDQSDFFLMCLEAELRDLEQAITNYLIAPLVRMNFGDDASFPIWKFEPLSDADKQKALDIWAALVVAATRPTGPLWDAIEEKAIQGLNIDPGKLEPEEGEGTPTDGRPPDWQEAHKALLELLNQTQGGPPANGGGAAPTLPPPADGPPAATGGATPRATPSTHGNPNGARRGR
jgi:hypothetical protein